MAKNKFTFLIFLTALLFVPAIKGPLLWDDRELLAENNKIRELSNAIKFFKPDYIGETHRSDRYRPLRFAIFAVENALWGLNPIGYHAFNIAIHMANALLIYRLVLRLSGSVFTSALASLFFATHPAAAESVAYVKSLTDLLALFFSLLSLLLFIDASGQSHLKCFNYGAALVSFAAALLSKETAIVLPILILCFVIALCPGRERRRAMLRATPFFLLAALYVLFLLSIFSGAQKRALSFLPHLGLVFRTYTYYFQAMLLPSNLSAWSSLAPDVAPSYNLSAMAFIIPSAVLLCLRRKLDPTIKLSILWSVVSLLPVSNIVLIGQRNVAHQRLYLPLVGYGLALSFLFQKSMEADFRIISYSRAKKIAAASIAIGLMANGASALKLARLWGAEERLWADTINKSPLNPEAHNNLGSAFAVKKFYARALAEYKEAIRLNPRSRDAYFNLGNLYKDLGLSSSAIQWYNRNLEIFPGAFQSYNNIAAIYQSQGLPNKAISQYMAAMQIKPDHAPVHFNLANSFLSKGFSKKAAKYFQSAIALEPDFLEARVNLGHIYKTQGLLSEARWELEKAVKIDPRSWRARFSLGTVLMDSGALDKAALEFKNSIGIKGPTQTVETKLGEIYEKRGQNRIDRRGSP